MSDFVHIHNHSQYSKFDGFATVKELVSQAKKLNMPAVGLTDHGTVAGVIHFLKECRRQKIQPIIGMESYMARDHFCHDMKCQPDKREGNNHLNLIAKNVKGLSNLFSLSQKASLEGFYYDPRIDFDLLYEHREGLIVTSACIKSLINRLLLSDKYKEAKRTASLFKDVFGDDFYLEMMFHGITKEMIVLPQIQKLSKELDIKSIATNDIHYIEKSDAKYQEMLLCMNTGRCLRDPNHMKLSCDEFYFKTEEEMKMMFGHCLQSMKNTLEIAEKCNYDDLQFGKMYLPKFDIPEEFESSYDYLESLAKEGLKREGWENRSEYVERLNYELGVIKLILDTKKYDFPTYFLIVEDIMKFAKKKNILAGIRGSACGSLLLKCLGVTEIDPLPHKLLFERFLGTERQNFLCEQDFGIKPKIK